MILRQPATRWQDALPSGNGPIGALVYGMIRNEIIVLNHEALWFRNPIGEVPSVSEHLPELRQMLFEGKYPEATNFLRDKMKEQGYENNIDPYHPAFDIWLEMDTKSAFTNYRRGLDLRTGEATVTWTEGGTQYSRQLFVSRADNAVVLNVKANQPGRIDCAIALKPHNQRALDVIDLKKLGFPPDTKPLTFESSADGEWLMIKGTYHIGGEYGGLARVVTRGGTVEASADTITVRDADEVLVITQLFANEDSEPAFSSLRKHIESLEPEYDALLARHVPLHRELFDRVSLDLGGGAKHETTNDELLMEAYDGDVPTALIEKLVDYGRYLLISSSSPGGLPANLQGVWNGDYLPAWDSDFHNDENIQMNYWQALPGNLAETTLPYFDYYESSIEDYRMNARSVYGCRGIFAPISQSTHGKIYTGWGASIAWTAGAGWLAQLFYDFWLFTGDREFLKNRAVPFLKETALFYEDFLFENDAGKYVFSPSHSPENVPAIPNGSPVAINATMDIAVAKEVLSSLYAACKELGIEQENVGRWREMLKKMPEYELNEDGAMREWLYPELKDNYHHRHISHLYPLFPGLEITEESDPVLSEAVRVAVEKRLVIGLVSQTGWSLAHMANIYARLGDGDRALECLELITRACVGPNLFTYHNDWRGEGVTMFYWHGKYPPFQIDANFGLTAAVLEMLVYSKPGMIKLLPGLPSAWPVGSVRGLLCRGGIEVSMNWNLPEGKLEALLLSRTDQEVAVKFPTDFRSIKCEPQIDVSDSAQGPAYRKLKLPAGKQVRLAVAI